MLRETERVYNGSGREYVEKHHAIPVLADRFEVCLKEALGGVSRH